MERTGITIQHFYSATYVQANRWTQRRQNRTRDEENKDLKISLVRSWLRKSWKQKDGEGRKAHRGRGAGEHRKWEGLCYDAVLGLCSMDCEWGSLNKHEVNKSICFNFHILFILPLHTNNCIYTELYCLLAFASPSLTSSAVKYSCHCHGEKTETTYNIFSETILPFQHTYFWLIFLCM